MTQRAYDQTMLCDDLGMRTCRTLMKLLSQSCLSLCISSPISLSPHLSACPCLSFSLLTCLSLPPSVLPHLFSCLSMYSSVSVLNCAPPSPQLSFSLLACLSSHLSVSLPVSLLAYLSPHISVMNLFKNFDSFKSTLVSTQLMFES